MFPFFKQKTAYAIVDCDWSSDVCSSDLYLNIDATIQYVLPEGEIVREEDYHTVQSPYNTYENKGLPPGPIANPGMESIMAALNPNSTNYYYYALGDDGVHHFFSTNSAFQAFLNS